MPYAFFVAFAAYSFLLLIEKVAFSATSLLPAQDIHSHGDQLNDVNVDSQGDSDEDEETLKNVITTKGKFASFLQIRNCNVN